MYTAASALSSLLERTPSSVAENENGERKDEREERERVLMLLATPVAIHQRIVISHVKVSFLLLAKLNSISLDRKCGSSLLFVSLSLARSFVRRISRKVINF
jgi:hypothetical protein